ncbi:hypothetical protein [Rothia kristinae]|uniref:hypothetical protein n=1 Tax=Rothia kristinae TaxID=37923 RepID=UPI0011A70BBF|nr:hypothetical protein [Rothia kristinae]
MVRLGGGVLFGLLAGLRGQLSHEQTGDEAQQVEDQEQRCDQGGGDSEEESADRCDGQGDRRITALVRCQGSAYHALIQDLHQQAGGG